MPDEELPADLWAFADQLSTAADFRRFVQRLEKDAESQDLTRDRSLLNSAIASLIERSRNEVSIAEEVIQAHILPACIERPRSILLTLLDAHGAREVLAHWLSQYPDESRVPLRSRILLMLQRRPSAASIKTIAAIGFRSSWTEIALPVFAKKKGSVGHAAINALCALSPTPALKTRLVGEVLRRVPRARRRQWDFAIQELASTRFIPVLESWLTDKADNWHAAFLLGRIAGRAPCDYPRQRRIWRAFQTAMENRNQVIVVGNTLENCNSALVVSTLLARLGQPGFPLHLVSNQLADCFRPTQLKGWQFADKTALKTTLRPYITAPGSNSMSMTVEDHMRGEAWEIALCAGITDISDWLPETARSPFGASEALSYASYIPLTEPPRLAQQLVTESVDINVSRDLLLAPRLAASRVLAASETVRSLEVLVNCGTTAGGAPLRSISGLIGDLVDRLSMHSIGPVLEILLDAGKERSRGDARMLAVAGLQRLAARELIPNHCLARILPLTADSSLPDYALASTIWIAASFPASGRNDLFVERLVSGVVQPDASVEIRFQSIQALIQLSIWRDHLGVILKSLGIAADSGRIDESKLKTYAGWQGYAVGLLVVRDPDTFYTAAEQIVCESAGSTVHLLLRALENSRDARNTFVDKLARLAISRSKRLLGRSFGETDEFRSIARLNGREMSAADWETVWGNWMPQVRASLADALQDIPDHERSTERTTELLEMLMADSTYVVRRSAARAYSRIDMEGLNRLCHRWRNAGHTDLRVRCAEVSQWFPSDNPKSIDNEILRHLILDPEPSVRAAAEKSIHELRRREWLDAAVAFIKAADDTQGEQYISRCYCYGRAIIALANDETITELRGLLHGRHTSVNVRNWLRHLIEAAEKRWQDELRKWSEPVSVWSGQIEELDTTIEIEGRSFTSRLSLWLRRQNDPTDTMAWGGSFIEPTIEHRMPQLRNPPLDPMRISIHGRRTAMIWCNSRTFDGQVFFVGTGQYPEPTDPGDSLT